LEQALETIKILKPKKTYLTHLGHDFDYQKSRKMLPKGVFFAYDGLAINSHPEKGLL
jgi:phosphoribosyl 1,2-cyclic phosphate phosphodiesterase